MRKFLILIFIANLLLMLASLWILPDQVAIHFHGGGMPDAWASKWVNAVIFIAIQIPLFLLFISVGRLTLKMPVSWISLPNKQYWLKLENRAELETRFSTLMEEFGVVLFLLLFIVGLLTLDANLSDPVRLNEPLFLSVFIGFVLYVPYWLVKLFRRLKLPG